MKQAVIAALVCFNAALLLALMFGPGTPRADAQVYRGGTDYIMVSGRIGTDSEALYIVDLAQRRLVGLRYDRQNKRMQRIRPRDLTNDFRRETEPAPVPRGSRSGGRRTR